MKIILVNKLLFTIILLLYSSSILAGEKEDAVKTSFNNYTAAALAKQGNIAAKYVNSKTIVYYDTILSKTMSADSIALEELNMMDRFTVLTLRFHTGRENFVQMKNGKDLFAYLINEGMTGMNYSMENMLGKVEIEGNTARAQFVSNGEESGYDFLFDHEDGIWKLDIYQMITDALPEMEEEAQKQEMTEDQFILHMIETLLGRNPGVDLWQPLE